MAFVSDCGMTTLWPVFVTVVRMSFGICHKWKSRQLKAGSVKPKLATSTRGISVGELPVPMLLWAAENHVVRD
jgi:hypothetical protein